MRMQEKTIVLVRGASPFGLTVASALLAEGAACVLVLDSDERIAAVNADAPADDRLRFLLTDPADPDAMKETAKEIREEADQIHAIINLQDVPGGASLQEITEEQWQTVIEGNLSELYFSAHALMPLLKEHAYGRVVFLTSVAGRQPACPDIAYSAAKCGAMGFTRGLAMENRLNGIIVNSIAAGDLSDPAVVNATVHAILYLASDEASWTTGDCMDVNGGSFMQN